jgi:hypothetical protein
MLSYNQILIKKNKNEMLSYNQIQFMPLLFSFSFMKLVSMEEEISIYYSKNCITKKCDPEKYCGYTWLTPPSPCV